MCDDKEKKEAAGHWQDSQGNMPAHYSATRAASSLSARLEVIWALRDAHGRITTQLTWDSLTAVKLSIDWQRVRCRAADVMGSDKPESCIEPGLLADVVQTQRFDLSSLGRSVAVGLRQPKSSRKGTTGRSIVPEANPNPESGASAAGVIRGWGAPLYIPY